MVAANAYFCHVLTFSIALTKVGASVYPPPAINTNKFFSQNEIQIVQASLLGSILANLLLILGMCFLFGGLRFREQVIRQ